MSDKLWIAILLVISWASLPVVIIYANAVFDNDVLKEGEDPFHH